MKIPAAVSVALFVVAVVESVALLSGMPASCLILSAGLVLIMGLGSYAAHRRQIRKINEQNR